MPARRGDSPRVLSPRAVGRVVLHVGMPSGGTAFVQRRLAEAVAAQATLGVRHPQTSDDVMLRAALDVRGNHAVWGRSRREVAGAWDALCLDARRHDVTTVLGHEVLAGATSRQAASALTMLKGLDVHVVVTAAAPRAGADSTGRVVDVLHAWGRRLAPDHVHALMDDDHELLWRRFARVVGLGPGELAGDRRTPGRATATRTPERVRTGSD